VGPTVATTEVVEDINGEPHGGVLPTGPEATTTEGKGDVDGGLPRGAASGSSSGHHQSCKNVDGAPLGGATGRSGSGHQ
jgi:hypothetical protein